MSLSMNVPNWDNAGVSPSEEKKQVGYAAGECLPAQHLNWFLNQTFTNLAQAKTLINKLEANMPFRVISGTYIGTGEAYWEDVVGSRPTGEPFPNQLTEEDVKINIGATPLVVFIADNEKGYAEPSYVQNPVGATYIMTPNYYYTANSGGSYFYYEALKNEYISQNNGEKISSDFHLDASPIRDLTPIQVVADTTTPTENQVKISDITRVWNVRSETSTITDDNGTNTTTTILGYDLLDNNTVEVGDYVLFFEQITMSIRVEFNCYSRIIENGFQVGGYFNTANKTYAYIALVSL